MAQRTKRSSEFKHAEWKTVNRKADSLRLNFKWLTKVQHIGTQVYTPRLN